jgi:hypothetical protein
MADDGTDLKRLTTNSVSEWAPAIAPDTNHIVYVDLDETASNMYITTFAGATPVRIGNTNKAECAQWLDKDTLFFFTYKNGYDYELWRIGTNSAGEQRVYTNNLWTYPTGHARFSIDRNRQLVYLSDIHTSGKYVNDCVVKIGAVGGVAPYGFINSPVAGDHYGPAVSPDGQSVAYVADDINNGQHKLYISPTNGGGSEIYGVFCGDPAWEPGGQWLAFTHSGSSTFGGSCYVGDIWRINTNATSPTNLTQALAVGGKCATACVYIPYDDNGNGVLDSWEMHFFGSLTNVTGISDYDNDRFLDRNEYWAGTDPTSDVSRLEMQLPASGVDSTSGYVVCWQSVTGVLYSLQRSVDLTATPAFSNIVTDIPGAAGFTTYTDTTAVIQAPCFYRIIVRY